MNTRSFCTIAFDRYCTPGTAQTGSSFSALIESDSLRRSRLQAPLRRGDTSVCSKEVAHSRYRVSDVVRYAIAPKRCIGRTSGLRLS